MFPQKSKWLKRPVGWEDLGEMDGFGEEIINGELYETAYKHRFCKTRVYIGKEDGKLFRFCPRCMVKINE